MKKLILGLIIIIALVTSLEKTKAKNHCLNLTYRDTITSDTVRFFRNLVQHQQKYDGQPFGVLLKDIPYKIQWYGPLPGGAPTSNGIIISFLNGKNPFGNEGDLNKIAILNILWKTEVSSEDIHQMKLKNTYGWGDAELNYFSPLIVDTVMVVMPDPNIKN